MELEMTMKLADVKEILEADIIVGEDKLETQVTGGAASDLMSDLLRNPKEGALLLTGLTTVQVIRTSVIAGMGAVMFVRGKRPDASVTEMARQHGLPLLSSPFNMYSSCGRLFNRGLKSIR
jgi:predicted transcriptional regulator